jgi:site-specific recombinase XerD
MQNQIEHTERELKIRNYSPKTIKSYIYGLKEYFIFKKQDFENLNVDNIKNFLLFCEKNAVSPQTRNLFLSAIKYFYRNVVKANEENPLLASPAVAG